MKRQLAILAIVTLFLGGCGWGMNLKKEQSRKIDESEAAKAIARYEGTPSISVKTKGDVTVVPKEVLLEKSASRQAAGAEDAYAWLKQRNPYTLLLIGAGIVLIVISVRYAIKAVMESNAGKVAIETADEVSARLLKRLKEQMRGKSPDSREAAAVKEATLRVAEEREDILKEKKGA